MHAINELLTQTITQVAPLLERGEVSPVELVEAQLARIAALDGELHSYVLVTAELARTQARTGTFENVCTGMGFALFAVCDCGVLVRTCSLLVLVPCATVVCRPFVCPGTPRCF